MSVKYHHMIGFRAHFQHFLEGKKGGRASWIWSSLLEGRELLLKGMQWQVMSGNQIKFCIDKWVPSIDCGHPKPLNEVEVDREMHVASVIHPVDGSWDLESMRNLISEEDCKEVSNIQVGDSRW